MKKVLFVLGMFLVIQVASPFFESFRKTNWSVDRAVKTYDIVMGNEKVDRSTETRFTQADFGKELLKEHPALGVGLGNFVVYFEDNEVHNSFLSTLYECGILGFTFLILLVLYILMALLVSKYPRRYIAAAVFTFLLFMGMNTFHIYFRERWVWFYFICLMFLFSQPKIDTPIIKSETI